MNAARFVLCIALLVPASARAGDGASCGGEPLANGAGKAHVPSLAAPPVVDLPDPAVQPSSASEAEPSGDDDLDRPRARGGRTPARTKGRFPLFVSAGPERPAPWFFAEPTVAAGWWPGVLVAFSPIQARFALHRSDSPVFRDTYVGTGGWLRVSPALIEIGPRIDLAPLDVVDVAVWARWAHVFPRAVSGRLPYYGPGGKDFALRAQRSDEALGSDSLDLVIEPTLKARIGPVLFLYRPTFQYSRIFLIGETDAPWVYDAGRDSLVRPRGGWQFEEQGAVLGEILDGRKRPVLLRLGGIVRHRKVFDPEATAEVAGGFFGLVRPGRVRWFPSVIVQALAYLLDADRALGPPQLILALQWQSEAQRRTQDIDEGLASGI